jgi:hypothetical protein
MAAAISVWVASTVSRLRRFASVATMNENSPIYASATATFNPTASG